MSDYICGTCKHWKYWCTTSKDDTCDDWTNDNEFELTDEEKRDIVGDRKAHEIMVEGREIL